MIALGASCSKQHSFSMTVHHCPSISFFLNSYCSISLFPLRLASHPSSHSLYIFHIYQQSFSIHPLLTHQVLVTLHSFEILIVLHAVQLHFNPPRSLLSKCWSPSICCFFSCRLHLTWFGTVPGFRDCKPAHIHNALFTELTAAHPHSLANHSMDRTVEAARQVLQGSTKTR